MDNLPFGKEYFEYKQRTLANKESKGNLGCLQNEQTEG